MKVVAIKRERNAGLVEELKRMLEQADSGEIVGFAGVKLRHGNTFACIRIGSCSDLELAGALAFAQHDLINGNRIVSE